MVIGHRAPTDVVDQLVLLGDLGARVDLGRAPPLGEGGLGEDVPALPQREEQRLDVSRVGERGQVDARRVLQPGAGERDLPAAARRDEPGVQREGVPSTSSMPGEYIGTAKKIGWVSGTVRSGRLRANRWVWVTETPGFGGSTSREVETPITGASR